MNLDARAMETFTDQSTDVELGETYDVTMTTGWGQQYVRIWIDYNDDFNFTLDELVMDNYIIGAGQGQGTYTETTQLTIPVKCCSWSAFDEN